MEIPGMSPNELMLYNKLMENNEKLNKWILVLYALVTKYAADNEYKIVIDNMSQLQVPTLDNPIDWVYDREADSLTIQIVEPEEKKLIEAPGHD